METQIEMWWKLENAEYFSECQSNHRHHQPIFETGCGTMIPKLSPSMNPGIRTQIWYIDGSKIMTGSGADLYGEILNHEECIILGQYTQYSSDYRIKKKHVIE